MECSPVRETHETGQGALKVPASLKPYPGSQAPSVDLEISTEKVGDLVLLRIDKLDRNE